MKGLTAKQHEIVKYIKEYIDKNTISPTYRDIQQFFGFSSLGTVYSHIKRLKTKGLISSEANSSRSLSLVKEFTSPVVEVKKIPIIGTIEAKMPISLWEKFTLIDVPPSMVSNPENTYALKVIGDSFSEELIAGNDLILIETGKKVRNGQTVVIELNRQETCIRKFFHEGHYIRLEAIIPYHQPIIVREEDINIQGVVLAIIRSLI